MTVDAVFCAEAPQDTSSRPDFSNNPAKLTRPAPLNSGPLKDREESLESSDDQQRQLQDHEQVLKSGRQGWTESTQKIQQANTAGASEVHGDLGTPQMLLGELKAPVEPCDRVSSFERVDVGRVS